MNIRKYIIIFIGLFALDQYIKYAFVHLNWGYEGPVISLVLAYNYGVAFSMFEFLAQYLKYIQLVILGAGTLYLYLNQDVLKKYAPAIMLLYIGGLSNILDRFTYGAVVDYVYWHYKFDFAIFNMSDVLIDFAVVIILYLQYKYAKEEKILKQK